MIEFFNTFNSSFYELVDLMALMFPFVLFLSFIIAGIMSVVKLIRGMKNEKR